MDEFHDYTLATRFERFVAVLEQTLKTWDATGLDAIVTKGFNAQLREQPTLVKVQASLRHKLTWRSEPYTLQLHLPTHQLALASAAQKQKEAAAAQHHSQGTHKDTYHVNRDKDGQQAIKGHPEQPREQSRDDGRQGQAEPESNIRKRPPKHAGSGSRGAAAHDGHALKTEPGIQDRGTASSSLAAASSSGSGSGRDGSRSKGAGPEAPQPAPGEPAMAWCEEVDLDMSELLAQIQDIMGDDESDSGGGAGVTRKGMEMSEEEESEGQGRVTSMSAPAGASEQQARQGSLGSVASLTPAHSVTAAAQHDLTSDIQHEEGRHQQSEHQGSWQPAAGGNAAAPTSDSIVPSCPLTPLWWPLRSSARHWWRYTRQHKLQRWFGLDHFLLLLPASYSRRLLDESEASCLLAAITCALDQVGLCWPVMLPVHDALRDAYWGAAVVPSVLASPAPYPHPSLAALPGSAKTRAALMARALHSPALNSLGGRSVHFTSDSVHISTLNDKLLTLQGQLRSFADQLSAACPTSAAACRAAAAGVIAAAGARMSSRVFAPYAAQMFGQEEDEPQQGGELGGGAGEVAVEGTASQQVVLSACHSFRVPDPGSPASGSHARGTLSRRHSEDSEAGSSLWSYSEAGGGGGWDADAPWQPWAKQHDPIGCLEVDLVWEGITLPPHGKITDLTSAEDQGTGEEPSGEQDEGATLRRHSTGAFYPAAQQQLRHHHQQASSWPMLTASKAQHWVVHALHQGLTHGRSRSLGLRTVERVRTHVELERSGASWLWTAADAQRLTWPDGSILTTPGFFLAGGTALAAAGGGSSGGAAGGRRRDTGPPGTPSLGVGTTGAAGPLFSSSSFSVMLSALCAARVVAATAGSVDELGSDIWWWDLRWALVSGTGNGPPPPAGLPPVPADRVLSEVLADIFQQRPGQDSSSAHTPLARDSEPHWGSAIHSNRSTEGGRGPGQAGGFSEGDRSGTAAATPGLSMWQEVAGPPAGSPEAQHPCMFPRTAPLNSLATQLALYALLSGNARAIALLWRAFLRELRFSYWEEMTLLPRMPAGRITPPVANPFTASLSAPVPEADTAQIAETIGTLPAGQGVTSTNSAPAIATPPPGYSAPLPDLSACLLHQKLQMLQLCIARRQARAALKRAAADIDASTQGQGWEQAAGTKGVPAPAGPAYAPVAGGLLPMSPVAQPGTPTTPTQASTGLRHASMLSDAPSLQLPAEGSGRLDGWDLSPLQLTPQPSDNTAAATTGFQGLTGAGSGGSLRRQPSSHPLLIRAPGSPDKESTLVSADSQPEGRGMQRAQSMSTGGGNGDGGDFYSAGEDEEVLCGEEVPRPRGALRALAPGVVLLRHPDRPLLVPLTQPGPAYTEDRLQERQSQVEGLIMLSDVTPEGSEAAERVTTEGLASDMAAFKAANPGAVLEDFLRWHSPKDLEVGGQGQLTLSARMNPLALSPAKALRRAHTPANSNKNEQDTSGSSSTAALHELQATGAGQQEQSINNTDVRSNPWHVLWATTPPCPAWEQKPLQDPMLEGERVLHDLESMHPADLFDQLLALGMAAAATLLGQSQGAALPAVALVATKFRRLAQGIIKAGCTPLDPSMVGPPPPPSHGVFGSAHAAPRPPRQLLGFDDHALELLLAEFHYLEQAVVMGESLVRRLPGCTSIASDIMAHAIDGRPMDDEDVVDEEEEEEEEDEYGHEEEEGQVEPGVPEGDTASSEKGHDSEAEEKEGKEEHKQEGTGGRRQGQHGKQSKARQGAQTPEPASRAQQQPGKGDSPQQQCLSKQRASSEQVLAHDKAAAAIDSGGAAHNTASSLGKKQTRTERRGDSRMRPSSSTPNTAALGHGSKPPHSTKHGHGSRNSTSGSNSAGAALPLGAPLRMFRPTAHVTSPAARLALGSLLCPGSGIVLDEEVVAATLGSASAAGGTPEPLHVQPDQQALQHHQHQQSHQAAGAAGRPEGLGVAAEGSAQQQGPEGQPLSGRAAGLMQRLLHPHWPQAGHREWVLSVFPASQQGAATKAATAQQRDGGWGDLGGSAHVPGLCSRMYVQAAEGEMRIALTVVSEQT